MLRLFHGLPRQRGSSHLLFRSRQHAGSWGHFLVTRLKSHMSHFSHIEDALEALAVGLPVIVLDSEDRENEGDFVVAAEKVTPQLIHFLITHGRGQVCMPVTTDTARRLDLQPMVPARGNEVPNFTVPVDHGNCKTGISPFERCATIRAIVDEESRPEDFIRPGHMFPLVARDGGVLVRQGHTEASIELVRMAGLRPAAVLCEICSNDGLHMARQEELLHLAADCHIPIVTIDALIDIRRREEAQKASSRGSQAGCESVAHLRSRANNAAV